MNGIGCQIIEIKGDLLHTQGLVGWLPTNDPQYGPFDTCSIDSDTNGVAFGAGVITIRKANRPDKGGVALGGGVTITTETLTQLTGTDWFKAGFLQFHVTTPAAASVPFRLLVRLARLGFSV